MATELFTHTETLFGSSHDFVIEILNSADASLLVVVLQSAAPKTLLDALQKERVNPNDFRFKTLLEVLVNAVKSRGIVVEAAHIKDGEGFNENEISISAILDIR